MEIIFVAAKGGASASPFPLRCATASYLTHSSPPHVDSLTLPVDKLSSKNFQLVLQ